MRNEKTTQAERKVPRSPRPAGTARRPQEDTSSFAEQVRALGPEGADMMRRLAIANEFRLWKDCARMACRRAGKCRGEDIACFDEQEDALKPAILRLVVWLMCTADISSDEFYDYLDEVTDDADDDDDAGNDSDEA